MYRVKIDPITKKVICCEKMLENTQIYHDDFYISKEEYFEKIEKKSNVFYEDGEFVSKEEQEDALKAEIKSIEAESEHDFFMKLVIDQSMSLSEARKKVNERRERYQSLKEELDIQIQQQKLAVEAFYKEQDRLQDMKRDMRYYSAVIMVIKHENRYLKEWIDWHLQLGFDHIYIYDNGTEEKATEVVEGYDADTQKKITVTDWSGHHNHIQQDAYNHFMENFKQDVRWGIFIDSDEFVRFVDENMDVNTFLKDYEDYTEIWGYEIEYNANGQETYIDEPVRTRFTKRTDVREGWFWKNFVQVNRISGWIMHYAQYNNEKHFLFKNENQNQDLFVIEHYYTKSWEEWQWKIKDRGGADPKYHKSLREFFTYNPDMEYLDKGEEAIQKYEGE